MSCAGPSRHWPLISYFNKVAPRCPWCLPDAWGSGKKTKQEAAITYFYSSRSFSLFPLKCSIRPCAVVKRKEQCRHLIRSRWPFSQHETVLWLRHTGWCPHWRIGLVQYKVTVLHQSCNNLTLILWICRRGSPCHFGLMIYYRALLVTGNWNSADLLLNCGRGRFLLKTEADYLNETAADLEMYSMQYVITTCWVPDSCYLS